MDASPSEDDPLGATPATAPRGSPLLTGVIVGVVVSFVVVTGGLLATGQGVGASLGLGAFVAFWGGLGFGGMVGGVVWATREEAADHAARTTGSRS